MLLPRRPFQDPRAPLVPDRNWGRQAHGLPIMTLRSVQPLLQTMRAQCPAQPLAQNKESLHGVRLLIQINAAVQEALVLTRN
jgi:hypothetical protein